MLRCSLQFPCALLFTLVFLPGCAATHSKHSALGRAQRKQAPSQLCCDTTYFLRGWRHASHLAPLL
jgi:hypothetical protein